MSNKKLPENATKTEGAELARRGRGEISTATAVPHVSYDDLRHADRITVEGLEVFANHGVYPEENALGIMHAQNRRHSHRTRTCRLPRRVP